MASPPRHLTKTELALENLRERIRTGELRPGERLSLDELTRDLDMSPTPIREALRLLQADRLVEYRAHHAIIVTEDSPARAAEVYRLRTVLEPLATELAVVELTPARVSALEQLHRDFVTAVKSGRGRQISDRNAAWHWAIYEGCESTYLADFIRRLWEGFPWRTMWAICRPCRALAARA